MNTNDYIAESRNIASNLKALRIKRGLSLAELSNKLSIPKGTVSYYECGYSKPSEERQNIFAKFYELESSEDLFMNQHDFKKKYGV